MSGTTNPLDSVIRETIHQSGGVDIDGDAKAALAIRAGLITELFEVSDEGMALLNPNRTVEQQIAVWRDANLVADARRLLAHALPPRHAMWWALLALTEAHGHEAYPLPVVEAFLGVRDFLMKPTEAGRRACQDLAEAADSTSAGGAIGYAAFLCGGSMAPVNCPTVLPKAHLCGRLCGVSVYLAAVQFDGQRYKQHLHHFIELGLQIARGELTLPDEVHVRSASDTVEEQVLVTVSQEARR
jgi:hypothetical protein